MNTTLGVALISSGAAIAGVLITLLVGSVQERARARREAARVSDDRAERLALATLDTKRNLYAALGAILRTTREDLNDTYEIVGRVNPQPEARSSYGEATTLLHELFLIAPERVSDVADAWYSHTMREMPRVLGRLTAEDTIASVPESRRDAEAGALYERNVELAAWFVGVARDDLVAGAKPREVGPSPSPS